MMVLAIIGNIFLSFLTIVNCFRKSFLFEWVRKMFRKKRSAESTKYFKLAKWKMANEPKGFATKTHSMIMRKILKMSASGECLAGLLHLHKRAIPLFCCVMLSLVSNTAFLRKSSLIIYFPISSGWPSPGGKLGVFSMFATLGSLQNVVVTSPFIWSSISL